MRTTLDCVAAIFAAVMVFGLAYVTLAVADTPEPGPMLMRCDVDPNSPANARRMTCSHVLELPPVTVSDYGNSKDDPNDPSNDPRREHNER